MNSSIGSILYYSVKSSRDLRIFVRIIIGKMNKKEIQSFSLATLLDICGRILPKAKAVVAYGTCAAFGGVQAAGSQAQLGLIEHIELALGNGLAQLVLQLQALQGAGAQALGVELEVVAAHMLGVLHGHVGLADQQVQVEVRQVGDWPGHRGAQSGRPLNDAAIQRSPSE